MTRNLLWRDALTTLGAFFVLLVSCAAYGQEAGQVVQAIGGARLAGVPSKVGDKVQVGDSLSTDAGSYLYIKTVDGGFLILRPRSEAKVLAYTIDSAQPSNNRIKFELSQGVARSISGAAVKQSRQNFRFNTPVAAIGVRGTDFTVFTDAQTTRVAVVAGGVVVSGFGAGCTEQGMGPCEVSAKRELCAGQESQVLQVSRGQAVPQLLRGGSLLPDVSAPPRADEPANTSANSTSIKVATSPGSANVNQEPNLAPLKLTTLDQQLNPLPVVPPAIVWGRWQPLLDNPAEISLSSLLTANQLVGTNIYFALLRNKDKQWVSPSEGAASFSLQSSMVVVQANGVGAVFPATLENGKLAVNFISSSFTTQFDLLTQGQRIARHAEGAVFKDGTFGNVSQFWGNNSMQVQGVLAQNPGLSGAYLFQSRLDDGQGTGPLAGQLASGITTWTK
jgi:hypothetical protein